MTERADACRAMLLGPKRATVLDADELVEASQGLYGDPDHLRIYGLSPRQFFARGVRILGRTAVECTTDPHAEAIALAIEAHMSSAGHARFSLVDLFVGSGNLLFHFAARTSADPVVGFERDAKIFALTRDNLAIMGSRAALYHAGFRDGLESLHLPVDRPCVVCLHPPWGGGFSFDEGLDLRRTEPPTDEVLDAVYACLPAPRVIVLHHIHERMVEASIEAVMHGHQLHRRAITRGSPPGMNSAYVICSRG